MCKVYVVQEQVVYSHDPDDGSRSIVVVATTTIGVGPFSS